MKTFFSDTTAYPWAHLDSAHFRGYFIAEGQLLRGVNAITYLCVQLSSAAAPEPILRELNGSFSFVWEREAHTFFAVDRLRGLPLFYAVVGGELWIGDSASDMAAKLPSRTWSPLSESLYRSAKLFVPGKHTLLQELYQVQAGCFCRHRGGEKDVDEAPYFQTEHVDLETDPELLATRFHEAYRQVGRNLVQALDGRTAVVPLSGGADSRMVLSMLKQEEYEKVLCFTYGREGNEEAKISKAVAEKFGYPWTMAVYTREKWRALRDSAILREYKKFAFNYVSTPHFQDFLAVKMLKEQGVLPADSVFVPGHSGDMIAGSHITPEFLGSSLPRGEFLKTTYSRFFVEPLSPACTRHLDAYFPDCPEDDLEEMAAQSEWFNIQERQAKFIVNSVRVYEFFDYEWLIPLWDNTLFSFWKHVPIFLRYQRRLYFLAVENQSLRSTNDATAAQRFKDDIRQIPFVRTLARRGTRILRYWKSNLQIEPLFPMWVYLKSCFLESPLFDTNYLLCYQLLNEAKRMIDSDEKA